jgi:hypothetical protein
MCVCVCVCVEMKGCFFHLAVSMQTTRALSTRSRELHTAHGSTQARLLLLAT